MIRLVCIDDILFYNSPNKTDIEGVLSNMRELKMELNVNADVTGFLGISKTGQQQNWIDSLNQENNWSGIKESNSKATPEETEALPADKIGNVTDLAFKNASIIGMLEYCNWSQSMQQIYTLPSKII